MWTTGRENSLNLLETNSTPLLGGTAYTTATFEVQDYAYLIGSVLADQAGTLFAEFSEDGSTWPASANVVYNASDPLGWKVPVLAPYSRFRFVNGVAAQGSFVFTLRASING